MALPVSTNVSVEVKSVPAAEVRADAVAVFVAEGVADAGEAGRLLSEAERAAVARLLAAGVSRGKAREVHFDLLDAADAKKGHAGRSYRRVLVVGMGKAERLGPENVRQAAAALMRAARKLRIERVAVVLPPLAASQAARQEPPPSGDSPTSPRHGPAAAAEAVVTGLLLAGFDYEEQRGSVYERRRSEEPGPKSRSFVIVCDAADLSEAKRGVERGRVIAEAQNFSRTIASRPGNVINPPSLAKVAQDMARQVGISCRVLDDKQMKKLGMGGILAVGAGSTSTPPRMIVLEWKGSGLRVQGSRKTKTKLNPEPRINPVLIVGKAITFDTGGISIKPADKMGRMIYDKCGGMVVLGVMAAIARLKLPVHVIGILAAAENHISDTAYRPGDVLRMYNGVTVEVTNTDAEGRLVLGDALAWGIETYQPQAVVDLATLTGGVIVALGKTMAGAMSNSDELMKELTDAAGLAGEKMWRLPVGDDQRDYIKSDHADIVNSGGREGHPLQGGAFLSFFVPQGGKDKQFVPWAHLDIAGVADTEKELPLYGKGSTGWGVRTLVEWITSKVEPRTPHATPRAAGG